ncbi:MAG: hypothetical protein MMC33_009725 [Icmadophila ericetorum]|nr:hypothetical protein [Icmadophila ericetorum]
MCVLVPKWAHTLNHPDKLDLAEGWHTTWTSIKLEAKRQQPDNTPFNVSARKRAESIPMPDRLIRCARFTKVQNLGLLENLPLQTPEWFHVTPTDCEDSNEYHELAGINFSSHRRREMDMVDPLYKYPGVIIRKGCERYLAMTAMNQLITQLDGKPLESIEEVIEDAGTRSQDLAIRKQDEEKSHFGETPFVVRHFPTKKIMF